MTFLELGKRVLEEEKKPLSPREIWNIAVDKGYTQLVKRDVKKPVHAIHNALWQNARSDRNSIIEEIGKYPEKYYLKSLSADFPPQYAESELKETPIITKRYSYLESNLHPFLSYYARKYLSIYTKTIQHSKSNKKEFGEWLHPDMVGCCFSFDNWKSEVVAFGEVLGNVAIKLFSFELKRELNFSILREAFFQTVSNSSWAHEGYLVSSDISDDVSFMDELRRLSTSFGIGVIKLNVNDPDLSEIMFPSKTKENLDWDAINKLAINDDFKDFLNRVKTDISTHEIREEKYDKILPKEELIKLIKKF